MIHLFDLDGTLLDSMSIWRNLGSDFLSSRGIFPDSSYFEPLHAMTLPMAAQYFHDTLLPQETPQAIERTLEDTITHAYAHVLPLKPGAYDYALSAQTSCGTALVATATPRPLAELALKRLGLAQLPLYTVDEVGYTKDDPRFYRAIVPQGTPFAVYEDALHAMEGAKEAGAIVIALADPSQTEHRDAILATCDAFWSHWPTFSEVQNLWSDSRGQWSPASPRKP